jgi:hypothetical protein
VAKREPNLVAWQWSLYPVAHRNRANLILHLVTVPLFMTGTLTAASAPLTRWWYALVGLGVMAVAFAAQGAGHKREENAPVPFLGPGDVLGRIFAEQWINFPRFVLSGGLARAWRGERT